MLSPVTTEGGAAKAQLRKQVLAARRSMSAAQRDDAASTLTRLLLDLPEVRAARCVATYLSIGTEPSTAQFLTELRSKGVRILLPVLLEDHDLDWAIYDVPDRLTQGARGLWAPDGPLLGVHALAGADVVVAPALAVGADGLRLGRGGGSFDRALARVPSGGPLVLTLLYDGELLPAVPADDHDRAVDGAVLPSGVHWFGRKRHA
jgi:5-formyltetrahydrofolate cyclo-ligase